jgi:hypothetical protein
MDQGSSMTAYTETLKLARRLLDERATEHGYGFFRPENPHDFCPDGENTDEEHAAHEAACKAWDEGAYKPSHESGWITPNIHVTMAPWGPGSYAFRDSDVNQCIAEIDALLAGEA